SFATLFMILLDNFVYLWHSWQSVKVMPAYRGWHPFGSFDHLVGAGAQRRRHGEAEGFRPPSGHDTAAPPSRPMNSRRLTRSPHRHRPGQVFTDLCQELTRAVRLRNVGIATRGTDHVLITGQRIGDGNVGDGVECRVGLEAPRSLIAVEAR